VTRAIGAAAVGLAVMAGAAGATRAHDPITTKITFAREIRAILGARCVTCHAPGGSAPMPLTTYEEVRPWARAIRDQILTRGMPKWHAARGFGAFANDPTLTPFEQSLLVSWLDGGLPEGSPARTVAARPVAGLPVTETSGTIRLTVPPRGDIARMAVEGPHWITGWTFTPGDPLITAAVISLDGVPAGSWVAGDRPATLPAGTGFRSAGRIRIDVRRRAGSDYEQPFVPRRSVLTLLTETAGPLRRAWTEQVACGALRSGVSAELLAVRPLLDRPEARLWVARAGAPPFIVGWFKAFDPLYPRTYWLRRPADFSLDARLVSDGPCRVELTLAAPAMAR
jgi:hypothetical protein